MIKLFAVSVKLLINFLDLLCRIVMEREVVTMVIVYLPDPHGPGAYSDPETVFEMGYIADWCLALRCGHLYLSAWECTAAYQ